MSDMAAADVTASDDVVRPSVGRWYRLRDKTAAYCTSMSADDGARLISYRYGFHDANVVVVGCDGWFDRERGRCCSDVVREMIHPTIGSHSFDVNHAGVSVDAVLAANRFRISATPIVVAGRYGWIPMRGEFHVSVDWAVENMPGPHGWTTWADAVNSLAAHLRDRKGNASASTP